MTTIGILGAGQLGRMLALAGYPLGYRFRFLDPVADATAGLLAEHLAFDYADSLALKGFVRDLQVITYEFENVPVDAARSLEKFVPVYPPPIALEKAQDRFIEKSFFCELGIPTPKFTIEFTKEKVEAVGFPAVLKTRRMGYDGKGQIIVHSNAELQSQKLESMILEEFIQFENEFSIIGVRNKEGEMRFYRLVENHHRAGILQYSLVTEYFSSLLQKEAEDYCAAVMSALEYVGVLVIEFFERDGQLLANEMAPRVHNSGHWTIEGAVTSQFENHIRAVSGAPLGSTDLLGASVMVNLVGTLPDVNSILKIEGAHLHLYDKTPLPNRKIGHITLVERDSKTLQSKLEALKEIPNVL